MKEESFYSHYGHKQYLVLHICMHVSIIRYFKCEPILNIVNLLVFMREVFAFLHTNAAPTQYYIIMHADCMDSNRALNSWWTVHDISLPLNLPQCGQTLCTLRVC